jgi:CubicO group peptidase (beta-lactamase class C family)
MPAIIAMLLLGIGAFPSTQVPSPPSDFETKVDRIFVSWNRPDVPGAAVVVVRDGRVVLVKGYGWADLERRVPITPKTLFDPASLAKSFTAFAVLKLEAQGKLSLDDDVRKHLPEFPDFGRRIAVRHLLYHTSGLRDWGGLVQMSDRRMDDVFTSPMILKILARQRELNFDPGTDFAYCNAGYILLAEIVARAAGQSFKEWTRGAIFAPLGMATAEFRDDVGTAFPESARSYERTRDGRYSPVPNNAAMPGPGSLFISADDLSRWLAALLNHPGESRHFWTALFERGKLSDGSEVPYAAGLIPGDYKGLPIFTHSGGWAAFQSEMVLCPERRFAVAVLTNHTAILPSAIARRIIDIGLEGRFPPSRPAGPEIILSPGVLEAYTGRYWLRGEQTIVISRVENRLFAQTSGDGPREIVPESEDLFAYRISDARIRFHRAADKADRLTLVQGAVFLRAERLPEGPGPTADLSEYAGRYRSDELDSVLEIRRDEKGLTAKFPRRGDLLLVPMAENRFAGRESSAKFEFARGQDRKGWELRLSLLDAWRVLFRKIE